MRVANTDGPPELAAGLCIQDRYRVESLLGKGGMGAVYRVFDQQKGRRVALKQLHPPQQNRTLQFEHFEREYHTLCQLAHPSIIEVYDYGVDEDAAFYTMELLPGEDLRERGTLAWREACPLFRDVASSLAILHSRRLIHRDISARNVRCTEDGRAKLIDFGAMSPMGLLKRVIGTAPFLPPEALRLQVLDGRSDLYALGALAYWTLTGRHAYPARNLEQLPELWRTPPPRPRQYRPEIPEPLERLVMELLELEASARPSAAAEVMERLCGVAGLPLTELPAVSRAYLVTPVLVGREQLQQELRSKLQQAARGRGGCCLLLQGTGGTGRTRMLAAAVLEAKLLGAVVLRADASDSAAGDYGVARALCGALLVALPAIATRAAQPGLSTLVNLLPELRSHEPADGPLELSIPSGPIAHDSGLPSVSSLPAAPLISEMPVAPEPEVGVPERRMLLSALRDFVLSVARHKGIVIAIDDFDTIDEPSAALIAMLAHRARRRRLALVLTLDPQGPGGSALGVVREAAQSFELAPLTQEQTAALLRSVFGDVDHVAGLSERVHHLSSGNPRATLSLCEHLVERGVARYEAGIWRLPSEIRGDDLPESLTAALRARIEALPAEARELAEALALTDMTELPRKDYGRLLGVAESGTVHRALDALLLASVLVPSGDRFRFSSRELCELLRASVAPERTRLLHARIAAAIEPYASAPLHARHLMLAGNERAAIDRLSALAEAPLPGASAWMDDVFEQAVLAAERLACPHKTQITLRSRLVMLASERGDYARFRRHIGPLLLELEQQSGLGDLAATDPSLPLAQRWGAAQRAAAGRNQARAEDDRGPSPHEATLLLIALCGACCAMSSIAQSLELVEHVPDFTPIAPLAVDLHMIAAVVEIQRHLQSGRFADSRTVSAALIERLDAALVGSPPGDYKHRIRLAQMYLQGLSSALVGRASAREWVAELEQHAGYRSNAWRVRMVYELMLGNHEAADSCRRRAELLNLQDSGRVIFPGTTARIELQAHIYGDDILGMKRSVEQIEGLAVHYPGWQPTLAIARSHYRRLQGDYEGALIALEPALREARPSEHFDWGLARAAEVTLLSALGRHEQAIARGFAGIEQAEREALSAAEHALQRVTAEALARAGRADQAEPLAEKHIAQQLQLAARGLQLGLAYEARARVAIARSDEPALRRYAQLAAEEYRGSRSATLHARSNVLMREADAAGMIVTSSTGSNPDAKSGERAQRLRSRTGLLQAAASRLVGRSDPGERRHEALRLLLELVGAERGYLYGVRGDALVFVASTEPGPPPAELEELLVNRLQRELEPDTEATTFHTGAFSDAFLPFTDAAGCEFEPLLLFRKRGQASVPTAIAALHYLMDSRSTVQREVLDVLVATLTEHAVLPAPQQAETA